MKWAWLLLIVVLMVPASAAQPATVAGDVRDASGQTIPGASILLVGSGRGTASGPDGAFVLTDLAPGDHQLAASAVGFLTDTSHVELAPGDTAMVEFVLVETTYRSSEVVVTALRRPEITALVPVSVSVLSHAELESRNVTALDDALRYAPGVQVAENQISVRGSYGFSYNVGSRVLLLVDGVPMLGPETGGVPFDLIPVPQIERIEIIKGPGSALYGSGALGGIINIITAALPTEPTSSVRLYGGLHDPVRHDAWRREWSDAGRWRAYGGISVSHARRVAQSAGGWAHVAYRADPGYLRANRDQLLQLYAKIGWSPSNRFSMNVLGGATVRERDSFLYWNGIADVLSPGNLDLLSAGEGDATGVNDNHSIQLSVLPTVRHVVNGSLFYHVRLRFFHVQIRPIDEFGRRRPLESGTAGYRFGGEWQLDWTPSKSSYLTAGVSADGNAARSDFFRGSGGGVRFAQPEFGTFVQWERQFSDHLNVLFGARFDFYKIDSTASASKLSPKLSASYALSPYTLLRASFGQGFRVPGIAERYINNQDFFPFFPNHRLRPETSTGYEIGLRSQWGDQGSVFAGTFDAALFWSDYDHLVEPKFVTDPAAAGLRSHGFQFVNLVRARIRGAEAAIEARIDRRSSLGISYTLLDASDLAEGRPLSFRSRHLAKISLTSALLDRLSLGADYRYASLPQRVDTDFASFVRDADVMVPSHVLDARLEYTGRHAALALIVYNVLDYYYVERPAYLAPPRRALLQLRLDF